MSSHAPDPWFFSRAFESLLNSMGTTALALLIGFFVIPLVVSFVRSRRQGWKTVMASWQEKTMDTAIASVIIWGSLYSYYLFYKVPQEIYAQADAIRSPAITPPTLPQSWDAVTPKLLKRTAKLNFGTIVDGGCVDQTMTLQGVALGDLPSINWPSTLPRGLYGTVFVAGKTRINVRLCNLSGEPITYDSVTILVIVSKSARVE